MAASKTTKKEETIVQVNDELTKVSTPLKGLQAKLQTARVALQKAGLNKSGENKYSHYNYFQLKDFLPKVNEIFANLGLYSHYEIAPVEVCVKETVTENGTIIKEPMVQTLAKLTIVDIETKEFDTYTMEVQNLEKTQQQNSYQAAGGRSTYYKRYLYRDALEIEEDDDVEPMTGAPEVSYQEPVKETKPKKAPKAATVQPQPTTIQQDIVQPQNNITPEVVQNNESDVNPDAILSQSSREEVMVAITSKGLDAFATLNNYCQQKGIGAPSGLKESDKEALLAFIAEQ